MECYDFFFIQHIFTLMTIFQVMNAKSFPCSQETVFKAWIKAFYVDFNIAINNDALIVSRKRTNGLEQYIGTENHTIKMKSYVFFPFFSAAVCMMNERQMRSIVYVGQTKKLASIQCSHVPAIISSWNLSARNDNESMHWNSWLCIHLLFCHYSSLTLSHPHNIYIYIYLTSLSFVHSQTVNINECVKFRWFALTALTIRNISWSFVM